VKNLMRNRRLARSIADASWGEFLRQITYKCQWHGKNLLRAGRFDASSKTCGDCGRRKDDLCLRDRQWVCPSCGVLHDRDINAARNIVRFAFQNVPNVPRGHAETKACGQEGLYTKPGIPWVLVQAA
jgi:putative transposase